MNIKNIFICGLTLLSLAACDNIDEQDRLTGPIEFKAQKNVLIEDFTGQNCINCPKASDAIHDIQKAYGENNVIAVSIHGGFMSISDAAPIGLATTEGNQYVTDYGIDAFPNGLIDRVGGILNYPSWSASVVKRLQTTTPITIAATPSVADGKININTVVSSQTDYSGKLQLWVIEDNITTLQSMPDGSKNFKYVHRHVFRKAVNGLYGEDIAINADKSIELNHSVDINDRWDINNVYIVAFVYDSANGVEQVISQKVTSDNNN